MSTVFQRTKTFLATSPFITAHTQPSLEETEWFECRATKPLGYVREPRYPPQHAYSGTTQDQVWNWGYPAAAPGNYWGYGRYDYQAYAYNRAFQPPVRPPRPSEDNTNQTVKPKRPFKPFRQPVEKTAPKHQLSDLPNLKDSADPAAQSGLDSSLLTPTKSTDTTTPSETLTSASSHDTDKSEIYACPVPRCTKSYRRRCRVIEHVRRRHYQEGAPMFKCLEENCGVIFDVLTQLKSHLRDENHGKNYAILFNDGKKSDRPAEPVLKKQKTEEGGGEETLKYKCKVCEKTYTSKYRRDAHSAVCTGKGSGEKVFRCLYPGCPKAYATKDSLTRHIRINFHGIKGKYVGKNIEKDRKNEEKLKEEAQVDMKDRVQELVDLFEEN